MLNKAKHPLSIVIREAPLFLHNKRICIYNAKLQK